MHYQRHTCGECVGGGGVGTILHAETGFHGGLPNTLAVSGNDSTYYQVPLQNAS